MAKLRRFILDDHVYHVASVTRDRIPIFRDSLSARLIVDALQWLRQERAFLLAYVVMPDHFHAILVPRGEQTISRLMQSLKGYTARLLNGQRRGSLWQQSFYDRMIRNERQLLETIRYIHDNPVAAGLVEDPQGYQTSSAWPDASTDLESFL